MKKEIEFIGVFLDEDLEVVIITVLYCFNCKTEKPFVQIKDGAEYVCVVCGKHTVGTAEN